MNTIRINVNYLAGPALDWAVAKCEGVDDYILRESFMTRWTDDEGVTYNYSTSWQEGGPIIEREGIELVPQGQGLWDAMKRDQHIPNEGPTPLIAAMRCYVASKLGEIVEVPRELYKEETK